MGRAISEVLSPVKAMLFLVAHYKKDEDIYDGSSCWSQLLELPIAGKTVLICKEFFKIFM